MFEKIRGASVREFMEEEEPLEPDLEISQALGRFENSDRFAFPVLKKGEHYLVDTLTLLRSNSHVSKIMGYSIAVPCVDEEEEVGLAAKIMVERGIPVLPVCRNGKYTGTIRTEALLYTLLREHVNLGIRQVLNRNVPALPNTAPASKAMSLMIEKRAYHLPVIGKSGVVGVLSSKELLSLKLKPTDALNTGLMGSDTLKKLGFPVSSLPLSEPIFSDITETYTASLEKAVTSGEYYVLVVLGDELHGTVGLREFLKPLVLVEKKPLFPIVIAGTTDPSLRDELTSKLPILKKRFTRSKISEVRVVIKELKGGKLYEISMTVHTTRGVHSYSTTTFSTANIAEELLRKVKREASHRRPRPGSQSFP